MACYHRIGGNLAMYGDAQKCGELQAGRASHWREARAKRRAGRTCRYTGLRRAGYAIKNLSITDNLDSVHYTVRYRRTMCLIPEVSEARFWRGFNCLRDLMGDVRLNITWDGASSISDTPFDQVHRALRLYAIVDSNVDVVARFFESEKQEIRRLLAEDRPHEAESRHKRREQIREELQELSRFQHFISEQFSAQANRLKRLAGDV